MGEIYRARDARLDRTVAIKILQDHLADRVELRERFEREAKTIASLNHPHICTLYDVGHQNGTDYLVMEYLEGETLAERLKKVPLPLNQVLQYAIEISDALEGAPQRNHASRSEAGQHSAHEIWRETAGFWVGQVEAGIRTGHYFIAGSDRGERHDGRRHHLGHLAIYGA
jgi:serine/threonine protein kinase